jgi:hypothetical protein
MLGSGAPRLVSSRKASRSGVPPPHLLLSCDLAVLWRWGRMSDRTSRATIAEMKDASNIIAADLSTPERILLFCVASGTQWAQAGVTGATVTAMVVRGLVDRDAAARLELTPDGRAVLDALLGE